MPGVVDPLISAFAPMMAAELVLLRVPMGRTPELGVGDRLDGSERSETTPRSVTTFGAREGRDSVLFAQGNRFLVEVLILVVGAREHGIGECVV